MTDRIRPREHCGDLMPGWVASPRSECVLPPGHQGSHADDRGARWWYDAEDTDWRQRAEQAEATLDRVRDLRDDLGDITGARWIATALDNILGQQPEAAPVEERAARLADLAREILGMFTTARTDDGVIAGHFLEGAIHPDDMARWRETLDTITEQQS